MQSTKHQMYARTVGGVNLLLGESRELFSTTLL